MIESGKSLLLQQNYYSVLEKSSSITQMKAVNRSDTAELDRYTAR